MYLTITLLVIFFTNVLIGTLGGQPFLGDVGEMLLLLVASIIFTITILKHERVERIERNKSYVNGA
jgi:VIT1/CCC1 family predicted Fe2+/Mn2+ transporter